MKTKIMVSLVAFAMLNCTDTSQSTNNPGTATNKIAKNIILLIGDGMGLSQVSSAFYYKESRPNFQRFENIGLINTSSTVKITDSAAAATSLSTGAKTYNGAIGVDSDTISKKIIVEIVSETGWNTGLIATSSITHATPASFFAHVKSRNMQEEIAAQLSASAIDFFAGGGLKFFENRKDGIDYKGQLKESGFTVVTDSLLNEVSSTNKYGFLLAQDGMPRKLNGRGDFLPKATTLALDYFSQENESFFLMVEGSQIDWGGHENNEEYLVSELIDFDDAIGLALDFAEKDGNTLVIVTADHETGGYTLASDDGGYNEIKGAFSTGGHSTTLIPVFAYGPGSEAFRGIYPNAKIFDKMMQAIDLPNR